MDSMTYTEALAYLDSLGRFGIRLGMERIEGLLRELGNPERKLKTIHVAGTNGKGSVATMITDIFLASGLHVGKFTSPHLVKYNERIELDGKDIADDVFAAYIGKTKMAADEVLRKKVCDQPTQFEILTAATFLFFAEQKVDYGVIEVGLGGLWDSTNVITPLVSVITNVALDHTDRLGKDLPHIAMQKAGIIKEKVPAVVGAEGEETLGPIVSVAMFKEAPVYLYGKAFHGEEKTSTMAGQTFTLYAGNNYQSDYEIMLSGEHQIRNASLAIVAAKIVSKQDGRITEEALHKGVKNTKWPGRLERISENPDVILDGAHNPNGADALRKALDKFYPKQKRTFVFGMMGDKAMADVIKILFRPEDKIYTVRADGGPRAAEAEDLAKLVGKNAVPMADIQDAYQAALKDNEGIVVVCGSLYLIGTFKKMVKEQRTKTK